MNLAAGIRDPDSEDPAVRGKRFGVWDERHQDREIGNLEGSPQC
jgi:hypothetical protein